VQPRGCKNIPSFLQRTAPIARSFCEVCTWHNLHILVTAPFCCDRKSPSGMCAKLRTVAAISNRVHTKRSLSSSLLARTINCSPGSQARGHSPRSLHRDHSIISCLRHMYMVLFFAHIPFVVNRAISATPTESLQQPHEAKALLELFCLQPTIFGQRQNNTSSAFAS